MSDLIQTRMGDGAMVYMTVDEIRKEAEAGMADAVDRAKVPPLSNEDFERLMEILCDKRKFVSVERGNELILTYDSQPLKFTRLGLPGAMPQIMQTYERTMMSDTLELAYVHYSAKPVRTIFPEEEATVAETLLQTTPLLLYGRERSRKPERLRKIVRRCWNAMSICWVSTCGQPVRMASI